MSIELPYISPDNGDFPPVEAALLEPNGLLAMGANLAPDTLIKAYQQGIFPWFSEGEPILWWSPCPRAIIAPADIHISRSMQKVLKKPYRISFDTAFATVITACAAPRKNQDGTWIVTAMMEAYISLHDLGFAHSVEVWLDDKLVGGLYGLSLGKAFFGESMFHLSPNASKVAFIALAQQLHRWDFAFIDCQVPNPHLLSLGVKCIPREAFMQQLASALEAKTKKGRWHY